MGQKIKLPNEISNIEPYANEVAMVSVIIAVNFFEIIRNLNNAGYMATADYITKSATEFVKTFSEVTDWADFVSSENNPYKGYTSCWDDIIIVFARTKIEKDFQINLS